MRRRAVLLILPAVLALITLAAAYLIFFGVSFTTQVPGGITYGPPFGLHNYIRYFSSAADLRVLALTVIYSVGISILVTIIGYPLGYFLVRTERRALRGFLLGLLVVTFFSGSVTRAYSWLILLGNHGLINTLLQGLGLTDHPVRMVYNLTGVSVALVHFLLHYFVFTIIGTMKNLPRAYEDASRDLGAGPLRVFWSITLPLSIPGVMTAGTLIYSLALSTFIFPLLLGGGRVAFVSNAIYSYIFINFDRPYAATASVIYLVVALGSIFVCFGLQRRMARGPTARA
jgi:ABC-type spermidine/putrescine transport system permease subunit I